MTSEEKPSDEITSDEITSEEITSCSGKVGKRVTFLIGVRDSVHHHSLMSELLQRAHHAKLAGATVFQGYEGFGASGVVHQTHLFVEDAPISIVMIDTPDKINAFLNELDGLLDNIFVIVDDVTIVQGLES